jgi:hypothetical protein
MNKPTHHIFVCGSYRQGSPQGVCHKKGSMNLLAFFEQEAADRGLDGVNEGRIKNDLKTPKGGMGKSWNHG